MSIYDELQPVASELFAQFKQGSTEYVEITPGNGPADEPGLAVETSHSINGAVRGVQFKYVNNGLATASDYQISTGAPNGFTFELSGFIRVDGVPYKIVEIIPKPAAGTPVAYTMILRR